MDVRAYVESHAREFIDELTAPDGLPAVFAEWPAADPTAARVLVSGHHDGQPVEPLEEWGAGVSAYLWKELATVSADLT